MSDVEFLSRVPPHSRELEEAVLSAVLQEPESAMPVAKEILSPQSFYIEANQIIFDCCLRLQAKGIPPDSVSVTSELRHANWLDNVGGETYVTRLAVAVPNASRVQSHAEMIHSAHLLRQLIAACRAIDEEAHEPKAVATDVIDRAERLILRLDTGVGAAAFSPLSDALRSLWDEYEEVTTPDGRVTLAAKRGIPTGYPDLDAKIGGFRAGQFIVLAARPSMGKTALMLNFAYRMAKADHRVGIFSLEMSKEQLAMRTIAMEASMPVERVDRGNFDVDEMIALDDARQKIQLLPLHFADTSSLTLRALRNQARRLVTKGGADILMVDYLQLMDVGFGDSADRTGNATLISKALKQLARELKVPVLCCSQLNRKCEERQDKRPHLADLRESGSIEQDADIVILVYRDDYYNPVDYGASPISPTEINICKNRNGDTSGWRQIRLGFWRAYTRFENYEKEENDDETGDK